MPANNPITKFFNKSKHYFFYHLFSSNISEYPIYNQHQCHNNQLKNHTQNHLVLLPLFSLVFLFPILLFQKYLEIFPKQSKYKVNSDSFALN